MIKIKIDTKGITAGLNRYVAGQEKAIVRALNKTAEQARTAASQEVRSAGYNIKASAIKKSFAISKASSKNLVVVLKATGQPIGLINYGARQTKSGVSINVKAGRQILRHAFITTMKNGHQGVFERVGLARLVVKRDKRGKLTRDSMQRRANLPIKELYGPSIPIALGNDVVDRAIMKKIKEKFPKIFAAELNYLKLKG